MNPVRPCTHVNLSKPRFSPELQYFYDSFQHQCEPSTHMRVLLFLERTPNVVGALICLRAATYTHPHPNICPVCNKPKMSGRVSKSEPRFSRVLKPLLIVSLGSGPTNVCVCSVCTYTKHTHTHIYIYTYIHVYIDIYRYIYIYIYI